MYSEGGSNTVFGYCLIIAKVLNCIQAYLLTGRSCGRLMILRISGPADGFANAIAKIRFVHARTQAAVHLRARA